MAFAGQKWPLQDKPVDLASLSTTDTPQITKVRQQSHKYTSSHQFNKNANKKK
jgi:hypothetical protein